MLFRRKKENARPTEVKTDRFIYPDTSLHFRYEKSRETPVIIEQGILDRIDTLRLMDRDRTASHHIMITDTVVDRLVGKKVEEKLTKAGYSLTKIIAPSGEAAKTMNVYHELSEKITSIGIDEQSVIFSLGGGAIANLAGFLAATLYRGIGLIHIPTSLMCMNDVAISLKQGINNQKGKNLVGSYYQPLLVVIDPSVPMNETIIRHGMSETIKHALAEDVAFFDYLLSYNGDLKDVNFLEKIIRHTIELKIGLMNDDMFENARAIILQYGHEVGHAIEYLSHFGLTHGEAISIGMRVSAEISHLMGVTSEDTVYAHKKILEHYKLPYIIPQTIEKRAILDALRFNKKTRGNDIRFALLEHVGKIWKIKGEYGIPCPVEIIEEAIRRSYE
ncbi:MAG: hypothetical protein A3G52_03500 [Candidatus Taylorbacteria bacterium RIFCSPLOWO2_12_FULL_43_20]|uniref:Uncharacterized protein n=1 Tax=Candidatus Taylorbacteria bacterium RIFCSPLOWO2_12_FULL_43_20 TaxID=1802332 RepID=A0A1G2P2F0_9BACT|nr:MAG: hypothetical protein A2825_02445 [Candidatus Taylorbacteria bacterium RIFCSPHIGHO2_01_FULL_43_120]OHA22428.1 MAG: hypothetical protein A3B98_02345 [Candidatus Taylorbacteria bacterium RIFCSPHIGHO2_02_FULL_43_55]OHA28368.1 MAG: hypothetical protein A3E92_00515 [Candidatus Taylorbacteria bacterium RIFCSPHIGHO2_12_FULL_42_34]OHA30642.1 MAG: hypothetical protein A3B09_00395 [Candidatus Taylorbacteria bacterium RIFCSPLOWO2_01_FULL_43_83]OHA38539.1 MAG: hypothetical protein A3H58_03040 [Candi